MTTHDNLKEATVPIHKTKLDYSLDICLVGISLAFNNKIVSD